MTKKEVSQKRKKERRQKSRIEESETNKEKKNGNNSNTDSTVDEHKDREKVDKSRQLKKCHNAPQKEEDRRVE